MIILDLFDLFSSTCKIFFKCDGIGILFILPPYSLPPLCIFINSIYCLGNEIPLILLISGPLYGSLNVKSFHYFINNFSFLQKSNMQLPNLHITKYILTYTLPRFSIFSNKINHCIILH